MLGARPGLRGWRNGARWQARIFSARQLVLAREHAPGATLIHASMTEIDFPPESFDVVVALYSIIHVPREEQPALVRRIREWLRPGDLSLAT